MLRLGIDIGGTFTDLAVCDPAGEVSTFKTHSTPDNPTLGVLDVLGIAARARGVSDARLLEAIHTIVHGTTIGTNAIYEHTGARVGLITTGGFRDIHEIWWRPERRYDLRFPAVVPLSPRYLRIGVRERIDHVGNVITPLDEESVREAATLLHARGAETVAVCLLFSFMNPDHELRVGEILREWFDQDSIYLSSRVLPEIREYERTMATALSAFVGPKTREYLQNLDGELDEVGSNATVLVMQCSGGMVPLKTAERQPLGTINSGPAAGPVMALTVCEEEGIDDAVVVDMGGTSFDIVLIKDREIPTTRDGEINRYRLAFPTVDVHVIGAGGGSIAWIDPGGVLQVGPRSAGAVPGPAAYGKGGADATVTDADLVLGYLDPDAFLGGRWQLRRDLAEAAIDENVAGPLGLSTVQAAAAIRKIVDQNMVNGIETVALRRGHDIRDFTLVAGGGAGPVHAATLAARLGISRVIVPKESSALCAVGMTNADIRHDFVRSYPTPLVSVDFDRLNGLLQEMEEEGRAALLSEGVEAERIRFERALDLRYVFQIYEVEVRILVERVALEDVPDIANLFHRRHEAIFAYRDENSAIEVINVRVTAIGKVDRMHRSKTTARTADPVVAQRRAGEAFFEATDRFQRTDFYAGDRLGPGNVVTGPAVVLEETTTIVVPPLHELRVTPVGNYELLAVEPRAELLRTMEAG